MLRNAEQRLLAHAKRTGSLPDGETFDETDDVRLRNDWF
jgi:hypothetical protein